MSILSIHECETKEQWLVERAKSIGASEVPTVLGLNPFDTPLKLWGRKIGNLPAIEETEAMRMGHVLEPVIALLYAEETKRVLNDPGEYTIRRNDNVPFMHATLDREIEPVEGHDGAGDCQIKSVGHRMAHHWEEGEIPLYVQAQMQAEMAVAGFEWGSVAVLIGGQQFLWKDIEIQSNGFIEFMVARVEAFWIRVQEVRAPEAGEKDTDALRLLYPKHVAEKVVELPRHAIAPAGAITAIAAGIKVQQGHLHKFQNKLKQLIGDAEIGILPNGEKWSYKGSDVAEHTVKAFTKRILRRLKT